MRGGCSRPRPPRTRPVPPASCSPCPAAAGPSATRGRARPAARSTASSSPSSAVRGPPAVGRQGPAWVVVAVPAAAADTCEALSAEVDELVCLMTPEPFHAVGLWYEDFSQTTDEEVRELLERNSLTFRVTDR